MVVVLLLLVKGCILVSGPIALIGHYGYIYNIRVNNSYEYILRICTFMIVTTSSIHKFQKALHSEADRTLLGRTSASSVFLFFPERFCQFASDSFISYYEKCSFCPVNDVAWWDSDRTKFTHTVIGWAKGLYWGAYKCRNWRFLNLHIAIAL